VDHNVVVGVMAMGSESGWVGVMVVVDVQVDVKQINK
jgi:hypothetical protein